MSKIMVPVTLWLLDGRLLAQTEDQEGYEWAGGVKVKEFMLEVDPRESDIEESIIHESEHLSAESAALDYWKKRKCGMQAERFKDGGVWVVVSDITLGICE